MEHFAQTRTVFDHELVRNFDHELVRNIVIEYLRVQAIVLNQKQIRESQVNKILNHLSIKTRMLLSISLFVLTLLASVYQAHNSIGANITFAEQEIKGNAYQRPLAHLLNESGSLRVLLAMARGGADVTAQVKDQIGSLNTHMEALKKVQAQYGADLQFTEEGLKARAREHLKMETVEKLWEDAASAFSANPAGDHDGAMASFISSVRGMIAHSGDTSNLILDPDLDSYYLMDVTLIALPQTMDRLAAIGTALYPQSAFSHSKTVDERTEAAVMARMLKEADIDRVVADMDVSLKEDANFYGKSARYETNIKPVLDEYVAQNTAMVDLVKKIGAGENPTQKELLETLSAAQKTAHTFWATGFDELDDLLQTRVADYQHQQGKALMVAAGGILVSILFFMIVSQSLTRPLRDLQGVMSRLAKGELDIIIPYGESRSEIGAIAAAIGVFKRSAVEKVEMEKAQKIAEEKSKEDRKREMIALAKKFEDRVQKIVQSVAEAASGLSSTASNMGGFLAQSTRTAQAASESASQVSQNMQSVAAAAEEMAVTIQDISSQVQRTNGFISQSVEKVTGADVHAVSLKDASSKVREVTKLIADIAGQTNLLALNATIEAARAGDAGKGFAVVATEVKNLASQTDKSIQDIEKVVSDMTRASEGVITSLAAIKSAVDKIFETSTGIASAVEEQSATVNDIVRNMQVASNSATTVTDSINRASSLSLQANSSSQQVLAAANDLTQQADQLDNEVVSFLSEVRH